MGHVMSKFKSIATSAAIGVCIVALFSGNVFGQNAPAISGASYSAEDHTLTLTFQSQVYAGHTLLGLLEIDDDQGGLNENVHLDTAMVVNSGLSNTVMIDLVAEGNVALLQDFGNMDHSNLNLIAAAGAFLGNDSLTTSDAITLEDNVTIDYIPHPSRTEITGAAYNAYFNTVTVEFSRPVMVDMVSELTLSMGDAAGGNVPFQGAIDLQETMDDDTLTLKVNPETNSRLSQSLEQLDGSSLTINGPEWAFVDTFYNTVAVFSDFAVDFTADTAATFTLSEARYDPQKNTLAMDFNRILQFGSIIANKITVTSGGESYQLKGKQRAQYRDSTATITVIREDQNQIESLLEGENTYTVAVQGYTLLDPEGNGNVESEVAGSLVNPLNTGTPMVVDTVKYFAETNSLKIPFTEKMQSNILVDGFQVYNENTGDTLTLNEPSAINRENVLQTLVLVLDSTDAFKIESYSSDQKADSLHLLVDDFSVLDLINNNGNAGVGVGDIENILYVADATPPVLSEVFYDTRQQTANFTFTGEVRAADGYSSGDITIGGVDVGVPDSIGQASPFTVSMYVDEATASSLSLDNLSDAAKLNLTASIDAGVFENLDGVGSMAYMNIANDSLNAAGEEISVGYGQRFWVRSFEAFAPSPQQYPASVRGIGNRIRVFVDNKQWAEGNVTEQDVDSLIAKFEEDSEKGIYNFVTSTYNLQPQDTDGDPLINVLFTDILDEYDLGRNDTNDGLYVHGYYTGQDTLSPQTYQYSNESDLIYLDCDPQSVSGGDFPTALNGLTNEFVKMLLIQNRPQQERWILEGLATMAEFGLFDGDYSLYGGGIATPSTNQLTYIEGSLKTRTDEVNAFLFHLYLYEKYGGFEILGNLAASDSLGMAAVNEALQLAGTNKRASQVFDDYGVACFLDMKQDSVAYDSLYSFTNVDISGAPVGKNAKPLNWSDDSPPPYQEDGIQPWSFNFYANIAYALDLEGNPTPQSKHLDADGMFKFNGKDDGDFKVSKVMLRSTYLNPMDPDYSVTSMDIQDEDVTGTMPVSESQWIFDNQTADGIDSVSADTSAALAFLIVAKTSNTPAAATYDFVISNITTQPDYSDFLATQIPTNSRFLNLYVISERRIYDGFGVEGPIIEVWTDADTLPGEVRNTQDIILEELFSKGQTSLVYTGNYEFTAEEEYTYDFRYIGQDLSGNIAGGENIEITAMQYDNSRLVSLELPDGTGKIVIPENATHEKTFVTAARLHNNMTFAPAQLLKSQSDEALKTVSDPVLFGPVNHSLEKPATVTIQYDAEIENPEELGVYYLYEGNWEYIGGRVDVENQTITTKTPSLGYFVLKSGAHPETPEELKVPLKFALYQNYPNPFNPTTQIRYALAEQTDVNITIYNVLGQRVTTLVNTSQEAGYHTIEWNATNDLGMQVSSGVYFMRITTPEFTANKKMVFLR